MQRDLNQSSISVTPIIIFGVLSLFFGGFMYWVYPQLPLVPPRASEQAVVTDHLFQILMGLSGVVFFLVQGLIYYAAIAFRAKEGDYSDGPMIHGNTQLEIIWTIIPSILVVVIAGLTFMSWRTNTAISDTPNLINGKNIALHLVGQRFNWSFEYATKEANNKGDDITLVSSDLHVYAGQDIDMSLNTRDILHSFWVPAMRIKQDLLPGRTADLRFTPIDPPDDGWHFAGVVGSATIYAAADETSEVVYEVAAAAEGEFAEVTHLELVDEDAEFNVSDETDEWVAVIAPNGESGYIVDSNLTGRYNQYQIVCAELCGGGHGDMGFESVVFLYESEDAMLNSWYNLEIAKNLEPPAGLVALGEQVISSQGCSGCHTLDALGWTGAIGPALNGIADRAASRAAELDGVANGAEYIAQSIRNPNAYVVAGYPSSVMTVFNPNLIAQEDLNAIISYLCTQTESGNPVDSTCGLENLTFDDAGDLIDSDALNAELTSITGEYE